MIRAIVRSLALVLPLLAGSAFAQDAYPSRPITVVVPFGAGTGTDVITRAIVERMARNMKATIVVDNKAGASGQIGSEFVARAQPDGYTLLVGTNSTHSGNPWLFKSLRYDPVTSFAPVGRMTTNPLAFLVRQDSPFRTAQDLLAFARDNPGKLSYGYGTRLNTELRAALEAPEVRQRLEQRTGSIVEPTTVEEFAAFLQEQSALWRRRIQEAGIQPE
ncbi:MAG TPA: tripartite tricarboxylate transporter substrate binding protein [Ramlibacter sp.]|nr:tripartite tricarboxylate transporter substrate binding protein [Ramlibacter sp.]